MNPRRPSTPLSRWAQIASDMRKKARATSMPKQLHCVSFLRCFSLSGSNNPCTLRLQRLYPYTLTPQTLLALTNSNLTSSS